MIENSKKIISLFLSLIMIMSMFIGLEISSVAEDDILDLLTYEINDGEVTITGCDSSISNDVVLPDIIEGYPVTTIGDAAFFYCRSLLNVKIPDSVTTIGEYAFCGCQSLTSITIPDSVTAIGFFVFAESGLINIVIPDSVTTIGNRAFMYCSRLTGVTIPESVTTIGDAAFLGCSSLTSITIPESVTTIGVNAFYSCSSLTSITIPESVITIGDNAFSGDKLESIIVDDNNKRYSNDEYGVLFNKAKTKLIMYPTGNSNTEYVIPDSVTTIKHEAFYYCDNLISITIPDSVTTIGAQVFSNCNNLASIAIPDSITTIGAQVFSNCNNLASIAIPDSITTIGNYAFNYCANLTNITIPDSITLIGSSAFYGCSNLTSVTIPDSVTTIGTAAFGGCSNLANITILNPNCNVESYSIPYNATIQGYYNSTAEEYASEYGNPFVAIDEKPPITPIPNVKPELKFYQEISHTIRLRDTFSVYVYVDKNKRTTGGSLNILYNNEHLSFISAEPCDVSKFNSVQFNETEKGVITGNFTYVDCASDFEPGPNELGEMLVKLTFKAIKTGSAKLSAEILDWHGNEIPDTGKFKINIYQPIDRNDNYMTISRLSLPDTIYPGDTFDITFTMHYRTKDIYIYYDDEYLSFVNAAEYDHSSVNDISFIEVENGVIHGIYKSVSYNSIENIDSVKITFKAKKAGITTFKVDEIGTDDPIRVSDEIIIEFYENQTEEQTTEESTTEEPTTAESTTQEPTTEKPVSDKLEVSDKNITVDEKGKTVTFGQNNTVESVSKVIKNSKVAIFGKDGKELGKSDLVGTGAKIRVMDNSGKILNEYTVCVPNDVDGNGKTTAADARLALRGSAKLEKIEGVYALASDVDGNGKVTAADARKILRISAGLEKA